MMHDPDEAEAIEVRLLVQDLIQRPRPASEQEVGRITRQVAGAPFNTNIQRVPMAERGLTYQDATLGRVADALTLHLVRRVVKDRQWASGTTAADYVSSLHQVARDPAARVAVFGQWGARPIVLMVTPTGNILPQEQLGPAALPLIAVIYSADEGRTISGYQFSGLDTLDIPGDALWIK